MAFYYVIAGGTATGDAGRTDTAGSGFFGVIGVGSFYVSI